MSDRLTSLRSTLQAHGQEHLLAFHGELDGPRQAQLLHQLQQIDFPALEILFKQSASRDPSAGPPSDLEPAPYHPHHSAGGEALGHHRSHGETLIRQGKVAAFTVAGGQGTRLGWGGPKGTYPATVVTGKPLFRVIAEQIRANQDRYGVIIPWYIMTSPLNDAETRAFFQDNNNFGLIRKNMFLFPQAVLPSIDARTGKLLLASKHQVATNPDGHGGALRALRASGALEDMTGRGIEHISYFQVDNPLVHCIDPVFIGIHDLLVSDMSSKTVPKADDFERVGNFVLKDGRLSVVEYSDLPDSLARARNPDGSRRFDAGNIAIHLLTRSFVERLTTGTSGFRLPWHRAAKAVPHIDLDTGAVVEPTEPNAVKLESFVFDALPLAERPILVATDRQEEFSPVKNAEGVDSVATARRDMVCRARRWLAAAGVDLP
ncbi:MAG: UDPGP type 1 family protein, partial [Planctomycetes bacterium]|nr:UDPGP type 1 family protein [Planctomycetota bacterium]